MRILNAAASGGKIFTKTGELALPEWPEKGYEQCPRPCDQALFKFLEELSLANGRVVASARWWEREEDETWRGPGYRKGTFGFRGSGLQFYFLGDEHILNIPPITEETLHFLFEMPWDSLFDITSGFTRIDEANIFIGREQFKEEFLRKWSGATKPLSHRVSELSEEIKAINSHMARLQCAAHSLR
jgi:hypothetical protein